MDTALGLYSIEWSLKIGFVIFFMMWVHFSFFDYHFDRFFLDVELPKIESDISERITERRLMFSLKLDAEGNLEGPWFPFPNESEERINIFNDLRLEEPRLIMLLYIDKEAKMELVYKLINEIQAAGIRKVQFVALTE